MSKISLIELTSNWVAVQEMIYEGEIDMDVLNDTLESIEGEIEDKADNYARLIKELEGQAKTFKEEEARLSAKRKTLEGRAKWLKSRLEKAMIDTGKRKFKGLFSFGIQKNPPTLKVEDNAIIPESYYIPQAPKVDSKKLKEDIKNGVEIPGVSLEQTESLRIR